MGKGRRIAQQKQHIPVKPRPEGDLYTRAKREAQVRAAKNAKDCFPPNFSAIPRFTIDTREKEKGEKEGEGGEKEGEGRETLEEKLQKFFTEVTGQYDNVRSTDCEGISVTSPSLDGDLKTTYHIVVIITKDGILEVLVRNFDGYVIAFRKRPDDPNSKSGWYVFADINLPANLFGEEEENYRMKYDSGYSDPENVLVGEGFLDNVVKILLGYGKDNYQEETDERFMILQTLFVVFGEAQRLPIIRRFLIRHLRAASWVRVGSELVFWMNNWSKLSKGILFLKLFKLVHAIKDERKKLASAAEATHNMQSAQLSVNPFKSKNIPLTPNEFLKEGNLGRRIPILPQFPVLSSDMVSLENTALANDPNDQLSLPLLISYVQLIKHEDLLVPHKIMRELGYMDVLPKK